MIIAGERSGCGLSDWVAPIDHSRHALVVPTHLFQGGRLGFFKGLLWKASNLELQIAELAWGSSEWQSFGDAMGGDDCPFDGVQGCTPL